MKRIIFKVDKLLDELDVTANYVARQGKINPQTVYSFKNNTVHRVDIESLEITIHILNKISKEKGMGSVGLEDVIDYK